MPVFFSLNGVKSALWKIKSFTREQGEQEERQGREEEENVRSSFRLWQNL